MSNERLSTAAAPMGRYRTPSSANGIRNTMMMALKMTAERIALRGEARCMTLSGAISGNAPMNNAGRIAKYLAHVVGDRKRRQAAARHQELFADLDDLEELRRVRVEVDHVTGLFRRLRAGVHRHRDVGLRQGRGVVGSVSRHRDEACLWLAPRG